jgi:hypothetical protein
LPSDTDGHGPLASGDHSGAGRGTLLLADISGYTAFLQAVAGAHAADMAAGRFVPRAYPLLSSLLDGIVGRIVPPFVLSKLEGDAVFAFAAEGQPGVRGQSVLDCLSACYRRPSGAARPRGDHLPPAAPSPSSTSTTRPSGRGS